MLYNIIYCIEQTVRKAVFFNICLLLFLAGCTFLKEESA